jgi:N-acetylmuramic acid 6-phosphate (MurNAc-6-P) etherase
LPHAATNHDENAARAALAAADDDISVAILMLAHDADAPTARAALQAAGGNLRRALAPSG